MMTLPLSVILLHYVADFLCQNDWMAVNKSKSWVALTAHVVVYSAVMTLLMGPIGGAITFVAHFATDAVTSRLSRRLYYPVFHRHWFFAMIGVDQVLHYVQLAWTLSVIR